MHEEPWAELVSRQAGLVHRRQLGAMGIDSDYVARQVRARRWTMRSSVVVGTTTGPLSPEQNLWLGVLHGGPHACLAGLSALALMGLRGWERPFVTVAVPQAADVEPLAGFRIRRTRRRLPELRTTHQGLPLLRIEPAALLFAAYDRSSRTASGLLAATVQQRLTTAGRLLEWVEPLQPLPRARLFRVNLEEIGGGAHSMAEIDVGRMCRRFRLPLPCRQTPRRDRNGRRRFTDCEWTLSDGRRLVLEVDGAFHLDVASWEDDMARERSLVVDGDVVLRCTSTELRLRPARVAADLEAAGLRRGGRAGEDAG